jgi:hypothetical protein
VRRTRAAAVGHGILGFQSLTQPLGGLCAIAVESL